MKWLEDQFTKLEKSLMILSFVKLNTFVHKQFKEQKSSQKKKKFKEQNFLAISNTYKQQFIFSYCSFESILVNGDAVV